MAKRKRRIRSQHPGVVIKQRKLPSGATTYRARFTDPDTGREVYTSLDALGLSKREARTLWAKRKARTIATRRAELASGAPTKTQTTFDAAITGYLQGAGKLLRASTLGTYTQAIEWLRVWANERGLAYVESFSPTLLTALKDALVAADKHVVQKGARRGTRKPAAAKRAPATTNTYLKNIKLLLNHFRARGLLPLLSKDAIGDALKPLPLPREQAEYLHPAQIRKLLEAAARHDAATFEETREEHAKRRIRGTTPRYAPIAQFTVFLLLTGCRRGEALALMWSDVDLDALDHDGRRVGEIRLKADATKTKHARTIGLEVSPALLAMLAAMKLKLRPNDEKPYVFGGASAYTVDLIETARARMIEEFDAPKFDWQMLRSTCATYLTNAQGIFGSATVFMSARQLGHSVAVAERHYLNVHRGIPREARTLEGAMQIESLAAASSAETTPPAAVKVIAAATEQQASDKRGNDRRRAVAALRPALAVPQNNRVLNELAKR
jgi:integrase